MCLELKPFSPCLFGQCINGSCVCNTGITGNEEFYLYDIDADVEKAYCDTVPWLVSALWWTSLIMTTLTLLVQTLLIKTKKQASNRRALLILFCDAEYYLDKATLWLAYMSCLSFRFIVLSSFEC